MGLSRRAGHDWGAPNLDVLGMVYMSVCVAYTLLFLAGLSVLYYYRTLPFVRMRNYNLVATALLTLHVYLVMDLIVYPLNGLFPCDLEFWIMNVYLPLGMALFQAQNMQLLSLSVQQKRMSWTPKEKPHPALRHRRLSTVAELRRRWREMNFVRQVYAFIVIGIILQLFVGLFIFFTSRQFHGSYGLESHYVSKAECRRGLEWLPSIFWQFFWTYGFGPFILFKIRHIQDIHHWSLQTRLSILLSLPGTPLWLTAVYSDKFANINLWWPPSMWFAPGMMGLQMLTIGVPLWKIIKTKLSRTRSSTDKWENQGLNQVSTTMDSTKQSGSLETDTSAGRRLYGYDALDLALQEERKDLFNFAATRDFTGENIVFLTQVKDWKAMWIQLILDNEMTMGNKRKMYDEAAKIYFSNVNMDTAEFPVNLEGKIQKQLKAMFDSDGLTYQKAAVAPWEQDVITTTWTQPKLHNNFGSEGEGLITIVPMQMVPMQMIPMQMMPVSRQAPKGFDSNVFDAAEQSVKYMVFTNTWVKYVEDLEATKSRPGTSNSGASAAKSSGFRSFFDVRPGHILDRETDPAEILPQFAQWHAVLRNAIECSDASDFTCYVIARGAHGTQTRQTHGSDFGNTHPTSRLQPREKLPCVRDLTYVKYKNSYDSPEAKAQQLPQRQLLN
ncbi:MAG: hypothetical protein M1819_006274 [Sarea resinae]|nr:MAG: hypothetical protein M1819_006274 [Sarea resinae]